MKILFYYNLWKQRMLLQLQLIFAHKLTAFLFILGKFIRYGFAFLTIIRIGEEVTLLGGYTIRQLIIFFLVYNFVDLLAQVFFRGVYWFKSEVRNGTLDFILLKPLNPLVAVLLGNTDPLDLPLLALVTIALITQAIGAPVALVGMFALAIIASFIAMTAMHVFVLAFGIITMEVDNLIMLFRDAWSMGRVPVDIYSSAVRIFITYLIPVALVMNLPASGLLGLLSWYNLALALLAAGFLLKGSTIFWQYSLKRYTSASS